MLSMDDLPLVPVWRQKEHRKRLRALLGLSLVLVSGCGSMPFVDHEGNDCASHNFFQCTNTPAQSWDQANLKRNDIADCRTGNPVYVAPNGNLEQCK